MLCDSYVFLINNFFFFFFNKSYFNTHIMNKCKNTRSVKFKEKRNKMQIKISIFK
ncbi:hypothetical protein PUN28_011287 [Cardiocondyla obscurior]|uniref:Uncharacterized protein n=1 Tax=Cardiocondyla obscurior TaxID=286306 RepID=A0AAW2FIR9_9HYME